MLSTVARTFFGKIAAVLLKKLFDGVRRAFPDHAAVQVNAFFARTAFMNSAQYLLWRLRERCSVIILPD